MPIIKSPRCALIATFLTLLQAASGSAIAQTGQRTRSHRDSTPPASGEEHPTFAASRAIPSTPPTPGVRTDLKVYPEPEPPKLPPAGESFIDPVFGTTILRLTDERDGRSNTNAYSYWPSFNKDSSRLFVLCDGKPTLYDFDGGRFRAFDKRPLFAVKPVVGGVLNAEDAIWSATDPDIIFGHDGMRLWSYNVVDKKYTLEKDFVRQLGVGHLHQMSRSRDDNVFAFTIKDKGFNKTGYVVWWRATDKIYKVDSGPEMDEVQVDKTGHFLIVKTGRAGHGQVRVQVTNLDSGKTEDLVDGEPDYAPGHSDNGSGIMVGADNWKNRYTYRKLSTPHEVNTVLEFGNDWSLSSTASLLADDESWVLISTYASNDLPSGGVFRNELLLAATDASKRVRRLAHTHVRYTDYWDTPRANISSDGRFAVFTSNWANPGHRDVFVVAVGSRQ